MDSPLETMLRIQGLKALGIHCETCDQRRVKFIPTLQTSSVLPQYDRNGATSVLLPATAEYNNRNSPAD